MGLIFNDGTKWLGKKSHKHSWGRSFECEARLLNARTHTFTIHNFFCCISWAFVVRLPLLRCWLLRLFVGWFVVFLPPRFFLSDAFILTARMHTFWNATASVIRMTDAIQSRVRLDRNVEMWFYSNSPKRLSLNSIENYYSSCCLRFYSILSCWSCHSSRSHISYHHTMWAHISASYNKHWYDSW